MPRLSARVFAFALFGLAVQAFVAPPVSAERVAVRAEQDGKSSLITFAWTEPVAHQHKFENGRLTVRFSRPIESTYQGIVDRLGGVVSDPKPGM